MSVVTNIILHFSILEKEIDPDSAQEDNFVLMRKINKALIQEGYGKFTEVQDRYNKKALESPLFVAAFNMLDLDQFIEYIQSLPWNYPEYIQIFVQRQEEDKFTLYEFNHWRSIVKINRDE